MPHEHINSTPAPRDLDTGQALERVTVRWTRAEELTHGELATGDITIATEWLTPKGGTGAAFFPTPELFDVRIKYEDGVQVGQWVTAHTYGAGEPKTDTQVDEPPCRYCGLPEESNCHEDGETYVDLTADGPGVPKQRTTRNLGGDLLDSEHKLPVVMRSSTSDDATKTYRDAMQVIRREGAPTWAEPCTGFWITLTRDDANHLIRKLRRAVHEAHGGDA